MQASSAMPAATVISSIEEVVNKVKEDFKFPHLPKEVNYDSPAGRFKVSLTISNQTQREVQALVLAGVLGSAVAPCARDAAPHAHQALMCTVESTMVHFCKSNMTLEHSEMNETIEKIQAFVADFNRRCGPGVSFIPPGANKIYFGILDAERGVLPFDLMTMPQQ